MSSLTTIYTSTANCHQHKIPVNFRSILEMMQQTSECVGKLNVTEINADRAIELFYPVQCDLDRRYQNSYSARVDALPIRPNQLNTATTPPSQAVVS